LKIFHLPTHIQTNSKKLKTKKYKIKKAHDYLTYNGRHKSVRTCMLVSRSSVYRMVPGRAADKCQLDSRLRGGLESTPALCNVSRPAMHVTKGRRELDPIRTVMIIVIEIVDISDF